MGWFLCLGRNYGAGMIIQGTSRLPRSPPTGNFSGWWRLEREEEMYEDLKWRFTWKERSTAVLGRRGPAPHAPDLGITVISTERVIYRPRAAHSKMRQLHSLLCPQYGIPPWPRISPRYELRWCNHVDDNWPFAWSAIEWALGNWQALLAKWIIAKSFCSLNWRQMTFVSCYLCWGREKAYLPGLVVCASSSSEGSTSGRQERSSKGYFLYLCICVFVCLCICLFVYLCICVFV